MLPDLTLEIEDMAADDLITVGRYTGVAIDTQGDLGMPPTGRPIRNPGIQIFCFADGKIVEGWTARDDLGVLRQLGQRSPQR